MSDVPSDLDAALALFDRVAANLEKAERAWGELQSGRLTAEQHEERVRDFVTLAWGLPSIGDVRIDAAPMSKSEVELARFDAAEIDEPSHYVFIEEKIDEPGAQLRLYRHEFDCGRKRLVRDRMIEITRQVDELIAEMARTRVGGDPIPDALHTRLDVLVSELGRLLGETARPARWSDLGRHLYFWESVDQDDVIDRDWPAVRGRLEGLLYDEFEPLPVDVDDLAAVVNARPTGPVTTGIDWARLDDEGFERLLFQLVSVEPGYENPNWLMRTRARDKGRDIEVGRVIVDGLTGTRRERIIVQCKHWQSRSINRDDLVMCEQAVRTWEPPPIDVLIVATSGKFTADAVEWTDKRNHARAVPVIVIWPDSHIENLLARRPAMVATFGLR